MNGEGRCGSDFEGLCSTPNFSFHGESSIILEVRIDMTREVSRTFTWHPRVS